MVQEKRAKSAKERDAKGEGKRATAQTSNTSRATCSRWRRRLSKEWVGLHLAELSGSEACPSVREREGTVTPFVNGACNPVKHRSLAVPSLSRFHHLSGEVMQSGGRRGERVSLTVELFGDRTYEP